MAAPLFSLVTAVYNTPLAVLEDTIASVVGQSWTDWEWVLVDDRSPRPEVRERLAELARDESRVHVHERPSNGGIVAASNDALSRASGTYVVLLDHDDVLDLDALRTVAEVVRSHPDLDYLYSDQDLMTPTGETHSPYRKPDWSPERFRHHMYTTHLSVLRRSLVEEVGGFRAGFDGSQDHDLVLRVTERTSRITHVPAVLYHWREVPGSAAADADAKPWAWDAGVRAVQEHVDRVGIDAVVARGRTPGLYEVTRAPDVTTPVSVVIPTRGGAATVWGSRRDLVTQTVRSVRANSQHSAVEFVVVYDLDTPEHVLAELGSLADVVLVPFAEPFNFSAKCNVGALHAAHDVLVFLNDDMEALSPDVIEKLIGPLSEPDVGAVGPKLVFENSRVQHAGVSYGSGTISHSYYGAKHPDDLGAYGELYMNREVSALTGACLAVRRADFDQIGGFSELLPINYNDVDLCLKLRSLGRRLVWLHDTVLFHFESMSRSPVVHGWERDLITGRWGDYHVLRERFSNNVV